MRLIKFEPIIIHTSRLDFRKICPLVWPLQLVVFSSTFKKDLKRVQCIDIDGMTLHSIFGEATRPSSQDVDCFLFLRTSIWHYLQIIL